MQLKIAFQVGAIEGWTVGEVYFRNLSYALRQTYGKELKLYLLTPVEEQNARRYAHFIEADDIIRYNIPERRTTSWAINGLIRRLFLRDVLMESILKRHGIDVVFGSTLISKIATLLGIVDFQHVHLPQMFSNAECISRNRALLRYARSSTRLIAMSDAIRKDFESFTPVYSHKVRVLRPISYIPNSIYEHDLNSILNLYHLPEKFVYLPNQFWKHKNHELVFQAVKVLRDRGIKVFVVCTGNPVDYRHPSYFTDLCHKISLWGVRDQIAYLGLIPREHVLLLMRQSVCVLNPSLFEGWGYTADEAGSVGKQVLLSDIPALCEQDLAKATFFNPHDCDDLVEKLGQIWLSTQPGPDVELEREAIRTVPERLSAYAEKFYSIALEAFEEVR